MASRRPATSPRSRAASTCRTAAASTSATGTRTSSRACTAARRSRWTSTAATSTRSSRTSPPDVGYYYYFYPTKRSAGTNTYGGYNRKAQEGEAYIGLSWKTISAKYWYATTNYFGLGDSFLGSQHIDTDGSSYFELNATYDFGDGWGAVAHAGLQSIKNHSQFVDVEGNPLAKNVTDWKIGATKDLSGFIVGLSVVGTSHRKYFGTATSFEAGGNTRVLASVSKTF